MEKITLWIVARWYSREVLCWIVPEWSSYSDQTAEFSLANSKSKSFGEKAYHDRDLTPDQIPAIDRRMHSALPLSYSPLTPLPSD